VAEESVVKIPPQTPPKIAAVAGCAVVTGVGAVLNVMGPDRGSGPGVLVIGAGGVGLSVVMGAALVGAYPIIVADVRQERLALALSLGGTHAVNSAHTDLAGAVREVLPEGVQWSFDAVGSPVTMLAGIRSLRPTGTVVAIGLSQADQAASVPINELVQKELRVVGSLYGSSNTIIQIPRLLELHQAGRLDLDRLLGWDYRLEDVNEAYARLPTEAVGRGVIVVGEP
jgi:S-(hydroxymethyl)glutathione dehydrogenase/alcohol dehydrogenase